MFINKYKHQKLKEQNTNVLLTDVKKCLNDIQNNNNYIISSHTHQNISPTVDKNRFKLIRSVPVPISSQSGLYSDEVLLQEYSKKSTRVNNSSLMTNYRNRYNNYNDIDFESMANYDLFDNNLNTYEFPDEDEDEDEDEDLVIPNTNTNTNNKDINQNLSIIPIKTEIEHNTSTINNSFDYRKYIQESREIKYEGYINSQNTNNYEIPLVCYTTWHTNELPPKMQSNFDSLCENNPEIQFELFDEEKCRNFIEDNYDKDVLDAYDKLVPSSYKSDLWRYCVLFRLGGIYIDIKYNTANGFKLIELCGKEHFVLDRDNYWEENQTGVYTALIVTKPRNKILRTCIQTITQNAETYMYGYNALYPTGPGLLGRVYFNNDFVNNIFRINDF